MHGGAGSSPASATTSIRRSRAPAPCKRFRPAGEGFPHIFDVRRAHGGDTLACKVPGNQGRPVCAEPRRQPRRPTPPGRRRRQGRARRLLREARLRRRDGAGTASAEEALAILKTVRPHAIITDIVLPGRDGFWLLEQLRSSRRMQMMPVVAVTAVAGREEILDAGFDAYVAKPVRPEGVADAVLAALALRTDPDAPPSE